MIKRGEIWWAYMPEPSGSEPGYKHPVLVLQSNDFNRSLISTVIVVVITSNTRLAQAPGNVLLPKKQTKLPKDSVANVSQIATLNKSYLREKIGTLNQRLMLQVEAGVKLVLDLNFEIG